jgi:hypothetical protein
MKILIGSVINGHGGNLALEIPGIGVIIAKECKRKEEQPFSYVELNKEQLLMLMEIIVMELRNERKAHI